MCFDLFDVVVTNSHILSHYTITVVLRKRAHGRHTLPCAQTRGWADICNTAGFYHKSTHVYIITTFNGTSGAAKLGHMP